VGKVGVGQVREIAVTGVGGVPDAGVTAVALNVTAVGPSAATWVTVWPTGEAKPLASNLNVPPGDVRPNLVIVKVGAGGKVSIDNAAGDVDLIVDVAGYFGAH
jgi:serine protease